MARGGPANFLRALDPSFVLGALITTIFYAIVLQPSMEGTLLRLYATEHNVEYVIIALFFWGISDVILKFLSLPREFFALRQDWLPPRKGREPISAAAGLLGRVKSRPQWAQESRVGRRLTHALTYAVEKGATPDYREYLKTLAEQDEDATHARFMLIRFVAGVSPLLGFLGTVVHFGTALSGISVDQMMNQLSLVVQEMGAAFNTTTVALGTAMTMSVSLFICERIDRGIDRTIDRLIDHELLHRFETKDPNIVPMLSSVQSASEEVLKEIHSTLGRQVDLWSQALEALFAKFDDHRRQDGEHWNTALELLETRYEEGDARREKRLAELVKTLDERQNAHLDRIHELLQQALTIRHDFIEFSKTMQGVARGEGQLLELQSTLATNLRMLRETQQLDEAMNGLTAAIHLLTARHGHGEKRAA